MAIKFKLGQKWGKYTVVGTQDIIHGKYFPNKQIVQQVLVKGKRGRLKWFSLLESGYTLKGTSGNLSDLVVPKGHRVLDGRVSVREINTRAIIAKDPHVIEIEEVLPAETQEFDIEIEVKSNPMVQLAKDFLAAKRTPAEVLTALASNMSLTEAQQILNQAVEA